MKKIILLCASALIFTTACGDTETTEAESSCVEMGGKVVDSSEACLADSTCFELSNGKWCTGTPPDETGSELKLLTLSGTEIPASSLRCIYRQGKFSDGTVDSTSFQLQFQDSPNTVAFDLYLENPGSGAPLVTTAGEQNVFQFEVFSEEVSYRDDLTNGEIELRLDSLPSPEELSDKEMVSFKGKLVISQLALVERSALGEVGDKELELAAQEVPIECDTEFRFSDIEF